MEAPNYQVLYSLVGMYPKLLFLVVEYSITSEEMIKNLNDTLIKTVQRCSIIGGIKSILFGDISQMLSAKKHSGGCIWETSIYNSVIPLSHFFKYNDGFDFLIQQWLLSLTLMTLLRLDGDNIEFINQCTVHNKNSLPSACLRFYPTKELANMANEKGFQASPGDPIETMTFGIY